MRVQPLSPLPETLLSPHTPALSGLTGRPHSGLPVFGLSYLHCPLVCPFEDTSVPQPSCAWGRGANASVHPGPAAPALQKSPHVCLHLCTLAGLPELLNLTRSSPGCVALDWAAGEHLPEGFFRGGMSKRQGWWFEKSTASWLIIHSDSGGQGYTLDLLGSVRFLFSFGSGAIEPSNPIGYLS